jgi:gp16 family phage-associated protein
VITSTTSVKQAFSDNGISIRDWARLNGFGETLVYAVLNGKNKASRGESYRIAVALGLKRKPDATTVPAYIQSVLGHSLQANLSDQSFRRTPSKTLETNMT